ncbi:hydroxymethylglutaryl-CoA reductase, degradative [Bdellovibrio bacteriovorus]|uniref:3-hydroxy-3-methylglutaryl coenzyme A reductase n=1 Tax=Bdellovibrio bacteriovorus TaxID=959 RepID=A0A1Z3N966_BDEBC|nr:hydroxymethylglutaryl-CoA reductase, degradative [Bdellovibrio bacteriovorus]ASD64010.1 hydroxymethylglutaryl-CoA reductase, degradative [Bdellovibrio bacteriovorus]
MTKQLQDIFKGFSKLSREERLKALKEVGALNEAEADYLAKGGLKDTSLGEKFIENVIGYFQLPLGVVTNMRVDGKDFVVPMAVEETSIVAACSKTAKWIRESGSITTEVVGNEIIGQIQLAKIRSFADFEKQILAQKNYLIEAANREVAFGLVRRGGGVRDLHVRRVPRGDGSDMAVIHILMDPCDAMGANIVNQVCEYLKEPIEQFTGEKVTMCILSNLVDSKVTRAVVRIDDIDPELAEKIEEASLFAQMDPYRAATNNKGVLNGIDPILIATGNDWRAVEAGIHAYACRDGQYRSITRWYREGKSLVGVFEAPLVVGTVGGVTTLHPTAMLSMKMLDTKSANELSRIIAAVGLVQNLGALKALTTVGIIEGHMKLHTKNLALGAGAEEKEIPLVQKKLEEILAIRKRISLSNAIDVLKELRAAQKTPASTTQHHS